MDSRFNAFHQELHNVQMEVKQVQFIQSNHAERLLRLERRQADDAAIKSVWNSPFPSVLGGTPQHGPVQLPANEDFDDFDEQGQNLLGSLHLEADDEPIRRGAASRANSVRFDESALQGSNWGQSTRHSGEYPVRPGSGLGGHAMMERSLSHKSDGRHSSAGHSVHSTHSVASGRASSLGLENNFLLGSHEDDSPLDIPGPPPGFLFLGSVPSIVRCWLTRKYAHDTLLYAVVCSGSQKSTLEYSLIKELDLLDEVHRDLNGVFRISIPVYFAEATVMNAHSRSSSPSRQVPYITADFEVIGLDEPEVANDEQKSIRIFIGSDVLRANNADLLLSQNLMTLYGNGQDRDKLSVPFVRPEDDSLFKHITTRNAAPEKPKLNASAPVFVSGEPRRPNAVVDERSKVPASRADIENVDLDDALSPTTVQPGVSGKASAPSVRSDAGIEGDRASTGQVPSETGKESAATTDDKRSATGIWGSWRQGTPGASSDSGAREHGLSGYQPAGRGRNMKVLKPQKSSSSNSARTGASYEPPAPPRSSGELRRKSQASIASSDQAGSSAGSASVRWESSKRSASGSVGVGSNGTSSGPDSMSQTQTKGNLAPIPRTTNPVGGASAFSWMKPGGKPKTPATTAAE